MNPYRSSYKNPYRISPYVLCRTLGHKWIVTGGLKKIFHSGDIDIMCGLKGFCQRCDKDYDDVSGDGWPSAECEPTLRHKIKHPRKLTSVEKITYII